MPSKPNQGTSPADGDLVNYVEIVHGQRRIKNGVFRTINGELQIHASPNSTDANPRVVSAQEAAEMLSELVKDHDGKGQKTVWSLF